METFRRTGLAGPGPQTSSLHDGEEVNSLVRALPSVVFCHRDNRPDTPEKSFPTPSSAVDMEMVTSYLPVRGQEGRPLASSPRARIWCRHLTHGPHVVLMAVLCDESLQVCRFTTWLNNAVCRQSAFSEL